MTDSNEPRKASDVLLQIEADIKTLLGAIHTLDLNQKIVSNKLSELLAAKSKEPPKFSVETVNTPAPIDDRNIPVSPEDSLPVENEPKGFRRTSRPETFAGDNSYLKKPVKPSEDAVKFPVQIPRGNKAEVIVPSQVTKPQAQPEIPAAPQPLAQGRKNTNTVPVMQRMVDKNGKSIFLADVSIINNATMENVYQGRTNGTGKWMASLPVGEYTVTFTKRNAVGDPLKSTQSIQVDGMKSPLELPVCIVKG